MAPTLTGEAAAWTAAGAHLDLPDDLVALVANVHRVDSERTKIAAQLGPPSAAEQIVAGVAANEALDVDGAQRAAAERAVESRRTVAQALDLARGHLDRWITEHRDHLIGDVARPAVDQLVADAAAAVEPLAPFAPAYDPAVIAAAGTKDQLAAWRHSRQVDEALAVIRAAWTATWTAATSGPPGRGRPPRTLRPGAPGGIHAWADPHAVKDLDVRDGRNTDVLAIAAWHHTGRYRLATITEMVDLDRRVILGRPPQRPRERSRRPVLLPAQPRSRPLPS